MGMVLARERDHEAGPVDEILTLRFDQRERSRLRATLLSGEDVGIDLPPGTVLRQGDCLRLDDGRRLMIEAAPEPLMMVHTHDALEQARIAYHVGNRHVPLQIGPGWLRLLPDHVLHAMIERLGGHVVSIEAPFEPESGAYGHSHVHHQHDDQGHGGRIHVFDARHEREQTGPDHGLTEDHALEPRGPHPGAHTA